MTTQNPNKLMAGGAEYEYVHEVTNGPTYMWRCNECGNNCARLASHERGKHRRYPDYYCRTCKEFWLDKGLAQYKVTQLEIPTDQH